MGGLCSCLNAEQPGQPQAPQSLHYKPYGGVAPKPQHQHQKSYAAAAAAGRAPAGVPSSGHSGASQSGVAVMPNPVGPVMTPNTGNRLPPHPGDVLSGVCVKVSDGDTIEIDTGMVEYGPRTTYDASTRVRIRMLYMDAPESAQAYGKESREALVTLAHKALVLVRVQGIDKYGRVLGGVYRAVDGLDINFHMVAHGHAWFYRYYANQMQPEQVSAYDAAERSARARRAGLWAAPNPEEPHAFRLRERGQM